MADIAIAQADDFGLASVVAPGAVPLAVAAMWPVAPGQWLAFGETGSPAWADDLAGQLAGLATVIDQSSAYTLFRISGADARRLVQKGLPVDLATLAPGAVVVSAIAHVGVIVRVAAADSLQILVFRSYAATFRDWLAASVAAL